ncbi:MAG: hypothetical protein IJ733_05465, partial [Lachnospiraceae bacterium]|nr:hypothetical protein [Lachnospiraceae bacterium]
MNINEISVYGNKVGEKGDLSRLQAGNPLPLEAGKKGQAAKEAFFGRTDRITLGKAETENRGTVKNGYELEEQRKDSTDISKAQSKANEDLAILSGEDCESMEEGGDSLTRNTREYVEHAIEKNKERKAWNAKKQEESLELRARMREEREKREAMGFA